MFYLLEIRRTFQWSHQPRYSFNSVAVLTQLTRLHINVNSNEAFLREANILIFIYHILWCVSVNSQFSMAQMAQKMSEEDILIKVVDTDSCYTHATSRLTSLFRGGPYIKLLGQQPRATTYQISCCQCPKWNRCQPDQTVTCP